MVGEIKVIFTPKVIGLLDDLVQILYKKEYFGFVETAEEYVSKIYDAVPRHIRLSTSRITPKKLSNLGSNYVFYKSNARTTWFIFFEKKENNYLITGIINNHCIEAKEL
ncbi:hypothetical protein FFWV33_01420 [Flavobacterium faecale]|uniref:Plasmid stabilization protein n=1 Tax=Flavobacterium faecale TaxID=1355330 RepID=A0A2S1L953_9FLAO|nr:hypothetical protein [Flavobacterium faecale]AWG20279.1 hypothetical protein FFWV33_01420 [Flavobacterium faecale]